MNLLQVKERLSERMNRPLDPAYAANATDFVNEGLRLIQDDFIVAETFIRQWNAATVANVWRFTVPDDFRPSKRTRLFRVSEGAYLPGAGAGEPFYSGHLAEIPRIPEPMGSEVGLDLRYGVELNVSDTQPGEPRLFFLRGREIEIRPPPNLAFDLVLEGAYYLPDLAADADENVLTIEAPDAVLYAALAMAHQFNEDVGLSEFWLTRARVRIDQWERNRRSSEAAARSLVMEAPG